MLAAGTVFVAGVQALLLRGFASADAHYPFDPKDALAIAGFCAAGLLLTRGLPDQRPLRALFLLYAGLGALAFALSSPLGGNVVRLLLLMGAPLLLLPLAARGFRPRAIASVVVVGALMWQALPAVAGWQTAADSRAQNEDFWFPAIAFLEQHADPNHRVQVVATADNWEAFYLAKRGVPLARGWFRQDDFPANQVLYEEPLTAQRYQTWLRRMGVRYVLLPRDPLDYSAENEAALLRSGASGLRQVARVGGWTIYELPHATPIATPSDGIGVLSLTSNSVILRVSRPGVYRLRLRYTPYWRVERGVACAAPREPWGTELRVTRAGVIRLSFDVDLGTFVGRGARQRRRVREHAVRAARAGRAAARARAGRGGRFLGRPLARRPLGAAQRPVEVVLEVVDEERPDVPADDRRHPEEGARPVDRQHHRVAGLGPQPQPEGVAGHDLAVEVGGREHPPVEREPDGPEHVPDPAERRVVGDRVVAPAGLAHVLPGVEVQVPGAEGEEDHHADRVERVGQHVGPGAQQEREGPDLVPAEEVDAAPRPAPRPAASG